MVPDNVIALAQAISVHYTGKPDSYLEHVSTAAKFLQIAEKAGWSMSRAENVQPVEDPS